MRSIPLKEAIYPLLSLLFFISCNTGSKNDTTASEEPDNIAINKEKNDFPLLNKYDCGTCHKKSEKLQGPSFLEISNKYQGKKDAVSYLSQKVIDGGTGVWGNIPMTPHPTINKEDLNSIINYILALK